MIGNILTVNHRPTINHHVEAIVKEKGPSHPLPICSRGQKTKAGNSRLSPPCRPCEKNIKRGDIGAVIDCPLQDQV